MVELLQDLQAILPFPEDAKSSPHVIEWLNVLIGKTNEPIQCFLPIWYFSYLESYSKRFPNVTVADKWKLVQDWLNNPSLLLNTGVSALTLGESYTFQLPEQWARSIEEFGLWIQLDEPYRRKDVPFYAQLRIMVGDEDETFEYLLFDNDVKVSLSDKFDQAGLYCIKFKTESPIDISTISSLKGDGSIVNCTWIFDMQLFVETEDVDRLQDLPLGRVLCVDTANYSQGKDWDHIYVPFDQQLCDFLYNKSDNSSVFGQQMQDIEPELIQILDPGFDFKPLHSYIIKGTSISEKPIDFFKPQEYNATSMQTVLCSYQNKKTFVNLLEDNDED
ncbi:uncharacterized protein KLLA0_C01584g [Kluyveromyces lactis]|uniref:KLLA0C01584p n=1 Tax=Kluyveromyces lactis (strain ATCC 8585 / CBS 2359 / DSM 70799 / NBRC 1267 / NRRL Y-1140 / WM37) TaxID=284590 RepID=Q6CUX3_KLULA|nr:uncharacterized protein KLLA0_C01584g [Kluyveromyces lactis]CAH01117.1 KLLA0C01584p [Kluyveromyces lactis]|eukprot:XP_452266.1 uncharacterized protein KLLA0_C01584g [Kluyveromyces lactis]